MNDEQPVERAEAQVLSVQDLPEQYRCMRIFDNFKPETLRELAQQEWKPTRNTAWSEWNETTKKYDVKHSTAPRTLITLDIPEIGYREEGVRCCPIMWCIWREGRHQALREAGDLPVYVDAEGRYVTADVDWHSSYTTGTSSPTVNALAVIESPGELANYVEAGFDGEADGYEMATQIMGLSPFTKIVDGGIVNSELSPDDRAKFDRIVTDAEDFYEAWDKGLIPPEYLGEVACADRPAREVLPDADATLAVEGGDVPADDGPPF